MTSLLRLFGSQVIRVAAFAAALRRNQGEDLFIFFLCRADWQFRFSHPFLQSRRLNHATRTNAFKAAFAATWLQNRSNQALICLGTAARRPDNGAHSP
jgi:hypothetical protein